MTFQAPLEPQKCVKIFGETIELKCHAQAQVQHQIEIFTSVNMDAKFPEFLCIPKVSNVIVK